MRFRPRALLWMVAAVAVVAASSCGRPPVVQARAALEPMPTATPEATAEPERPVVELDPASEAGDGAPGVSAEVIRLAMISDAPAADGAEDMFVSARRGAEAWARAVNARGGLAERRVEVVLFQSVVSSHANLIEEICNGDYFAMVGSLSYHDDAGVEIMNSANCEIPDFPAAAISPKRRASPVTFLSNPYHNSQHDVAALRERHLSNPGAARKSSNIQFEVDPFLAESVRMREAAESVSYGFDAFLSAVPPGTDMEIQAQQLVDSDAESLVWTGAPRDLATLLQAVDEFDPEALKFAVCDYGCYDPAFTAAVGEVATPVYVSIPHLPFDEQDLSSQLREYMVWMGQSEALGDASVAAVPESSPPEDETDPASGSEQPSTASDGEQPDTASGSEQPDTANEGEQPDPASGSEEPGTASDGEQPDTASDGEQPGTASDGEQPDTANGSEEPSTASDGEQPDTAQSEDDGPAESIVDQASSPGFAAWTAGRLFEEAVNNAVRLGTDEYDPALLTREAVLDAANNLYSWDARGAYGEASPGQRIPSSCRVVMSLIDGKWERAFPTLRGSWDCEPENITILRATVDFGLNDAAETSSTNSEAPIDGQTVPESEVSDPLDQAEEPAG